MEQGRRLAFLERRLDLLVRAEAVDRARYEAMLVQLGVELEGLRREIERERVSR